MTDHPPAAAELTLPSSSSQDHQIGTPGPGEAALSSADASPVASVATEPRTRRRLACRRNLIVAASIIGGMVLIGGVAAVFAGKGHAKSGNKADGSLPEIRSEIPVNTVKPKMKTLVRTLYQPGSIKPWAQAELFAKTSGYLRQIARERLPDGAPGPVKDIGSRVAAGEILVEIDVPELLQDVTQKESILKQTEAELEQTKTNVAACVASVEFVTKQLVRLKDLARTNNVSQELVDEKQSELSVFSSRLANAKAEIQVREAKVQVARNEVERAHILANYAHIRAPFDGVITFRGFDVGDFVQNATTGQPHPILTVAAIDKVKFVLQVPEKESAWVQPGGEVRIAEWSVKGNVSRVNPALDPLSRTRQVEVDLDNDDGKLVPGLYAEATVVLQKIQNAQAIPATAVYSRRGENFVLLVREGVSHRQKVRIRFDDGKELEVVKLVDSNEIPLDSTDELIVSNKGEIAEGQLVRTSRIVAHQ